MARDYENLFDPSELSDVELQRLVREELAGYDTIDADSIVVTVRDGVVSLEGRIGTDEERRIAEHVLTDVIGVPRFENLLVVDAIRRDEEPEAVDEHLARRGETDDELLGRRPDNVDDEAEHLEEDLDARLYGTHDVQSAIERGTPWVPPGSPTPEGAPGPEGDPAGLKEEHIPRARRPRRGPASG